MVSTNSMLIFRTWYYRGEYAFNPLPGEFIYLFILKNEPARRQHKTKLFCFCNFLNFNPQLINDEPDISSHPNLKPLVKEETDLSLNVEVARPRRAAAVRRSQKAEKMDKLGVLIIAHRLEMSRKMVAA